jgi:ComF family protein
MIVPVPLHLKKLKTRGFNQSAKIAEGFSNSSGIPLELNGIIRTINTETQTKKKRFERWENTEGKFFVTEPQKFKNQRIVLIDDVITTGATIEACCTELVKAGASEISIFTLCYATF